MAFGIVLYAFIVASISAILKAFLGGSALSVIYVYFGTGISTTALLIAALFYRHMVLDRRKCPPEADLDRARKATAH